MTISANDSGANINKFKFVDQIGNLEMFIDKVVGMLDVEKRLAAEAEGAKLLRALDKSVLVAFEELSGLLAEMNAVRGKHSSLLKEIVRLQSAVRTKTESAIMKAVAEEIEKKNERQKELVAGSLAPASGQDDKGDEGEAASATVGKKKKEIKAADNTSGEAFWVEFSFVDNWDAAIVHIINYMNNSDKDKDKWHVFYT